MFAGQPLSEKRAIVELKARGLSELADGIVGGAAAAVRLATTGTEPLEAARRIYGSAQRAARLQ
jgi:hypothetical protein